MPSQQMGIWLIIPSKAASLILSPGFEFCICIWHQSVEIIEGLTTDKCWQYDLGLIIDHYKILLLYFLIS